MSVVYFVDLQGFQYGKENFLCKEIAIVKSDDKTCLHRIIKMPQDLSMYNQRVQNHMTWITKNLHGLTWDNSDNTNESLKYEHISEFLKNNIPGNVTVAVKGVEKKKWLSNFIHNTIIDVFELNCSNFNQMKTIFKSYHCKQHSFCNNLNCSLEHAYYLYFWCMYCKNNI